MDPLSVSASIIGILGASAKVSSVLVAFVQSTKAAPKLAQTVLSEVNGLSAILTQLQTYLLGTASLSKSRASLILVEQVIVTLTECVTTFSELENALGTSRNDVDMGTLDRIRWAMKESKISDIQGRLQSNKASLTLMLTILQCRSMEEAESAMTRLCDLVQQVLASNQEMNLRLRNLDEKAAETIVPAAPKPDDDASTTSSLSVKPPLVSVSQAAQRNQFGFAFEEDLLASRVYRKPLYSASGESLVTSAARTTASSVLSALSLTDISNISILAVPVYAHEISNSRRYNFGDFGIEIPESPGQRHSTRSLSTILNPKKWDAFSSAVRRQRLDKISKSSAYSKPENRVLGAPLHVGIKYANVAISLTNDKGESFVYGYIPIFVGKTGVFLKEKATLVEDIFCVSGSALRLQKLEAAFNEPPRYGAGIDWSGYTVHDAAAIMIRFLQGLPESIIPVDMYEAFQNPLKPHQEDHSSSFTFDASKAISEYQQQIGLLPPLSRQLLLYLLDILAVFGARSEVNKMTSARLARVFQPVILSPVRRGEEFIEEAKSRQLSEDVIIFLIENQDSFLIGMIPQDDGIVRMS